MRVWSSQSDGQGWAAIVLKDFAADLPTPGVLVGLHRYLPEAKFLFPDEAPYGPFHGYVFVTGAADLAVRRLAHSGYVEHVVLDGVELARISDRELRRVLSVSRGISRGQQVDVISGDYTGLQGTVDRVAGQQVYLLVQLKSGDYPLQLNVHQVRPVRKG